MSKSQKNRISRRRFLEGTGAALVVAAEAPALHAAASPNSIRLTVNGQAQRVEVEDRWTLVEVLRDHLKLTGTKIGCDRGECGACTVLVDGKPMYSCSQLAVWMDGRSIQTVEGLSQGDRLDPLQKAFMEHDAPQCGFCTSGQLMSAKAVLAKNPHATAEEIQAGLTGNLCRCSNYNRYVEAALAATGAGIPTGGTAQFLPGPDAVSGKLKTCGHATTRIDALERVTGKANYTGDVQLPGMLYARVLRSPHPHARIRSIDTSKAAAMPGVKAVLTHENCSVVWGAGGVAGGVQYNDQVKKITKQRRYAFNNPVRFVGDPVAAVAASDRHSAVAPSAAVWSRAGRLSAADHFESAFASLPLKTSFNWPARIPDKVWRGISIMRATELPAPSETRGGITPHLTKNGCHY